MRAAADGGPKAHGSGPPGRVPPVDPGPRVPPGEEGPERAERRAVVKVENLHKSFGELEVLRGIDIEVHSGEVIVDLRPVGVGKSRCSAA